ncbi:unnamed protein product [Lactuca saligna]|uniref:Uncharacterized protein n=1 Tax=Lactuca saligna TaxID=75948 RepID=A0AA35XY26_LACSI|nr:unnamed protein product [Lactuca saligna]
MGQIERTWSEHLVYSRGVDKENRREVHDCEIHHSLRADLVEHIYRAHIQLEAEYWHDDLFDESDEDSYMIVDDSGNDSDNEDGDSE